MNDVNDVITTYLLWTECYVEESVLSALYRISFNPPNSPIIGCFILTLRLSKTYMVHTASK